jgi:hypothetical protein
MDVYLTTEELSSRIKYEPRYIREQMKDKIFKKGIHYIQPFGGRKILFIWNRIETMMTDVRTESNPMDKITLRKVSNNG